MMSSRSVFDYKLCVKCNKELAETSISLCKNCKPKREYNRTLSKSQGKAHLRKFELSTASCSKKFASEISIPGI
jgi:hypothetical protein